VRVRACDCESPGSHRYIENEAAVRGKNRLDLTVDPPPDLALEIDVTSRTHPQIEQALGVSELWRFEKGKLQNMISDHNQSKIGYLVQ
jgi:Uma2 family endonuclease